MTTERDIRNQIAFAHDKGVEEGREEGRETGRAEGLEAGIAKGREEGLEAGIAKGREEGREEASKAVARKLKAEGVSIDMISRVTGLTEEQILAL